jgi:hypothetical protein
MALWEFEDNLEGLRATEPEDHARRLRVTERSMHGWRQVAVILASERDGELLAAMGIELPRGDTRPWARHLLDAVDDFYEVYDVEPDGGVAVQKLEAELEQVCGPSTMVGLVEAAIILSRSVDEQEILGRWAMVLDLLWHDQPTLVEVPDALPARVRPVLEAERWPASPWLPSRRPEMVKDAWERDFLSGRPELEPDLIASRVMEHLRTERVLQRIAATLTADERAALVSWGNREAEAQAGGPPPPSPGIVWATMESECRLHSPSFRAQDDLPTEP